MPALRRTAAALGAIASLAACGLIALVSTGGVADAAPVGNPRVPDASLCCGATFLRPGDRMVSGDPTSSSLAPAGLSSGPRHSAVISSGYALVLGDDGNLVEYRSTATGRVPVWSTGTRSATTTTLLFQTDGNVVLRNAAGTALWSTGTAGRPAAYFDVYGNGQVVTQDSTGHVLSAHGPAQVGLPGTAVWTVSSPSYYDIGKPYRKLVVQSDGNLVEYLTDSAGRTRAVWSSRTAGVGEVRLAAQSDGNLVLRRASTGLAVWTSNSHGPTAFYQLDLQDDGNLVLYRTDGIRRVQAVWSTGIRR